MSDIWYERTETYTHHELRIVIPSENWSLPFCACGWVGIARYSGGTDKITAMYREHLKTGEHT